jgi:hypothetical protein
VRNKVYERSSFRGRKSTPRLAMEAGLFASVRLSMTAPTILPVHHQPDATSMFLKGWHRW